MDDAWKMVGDVEKLSARIPGTRLRHVISRDDARRVTVIDAETVGANGSAGLRGTVTVSLRQGPSAARKETVVVLDTNVNLAAAAAAAGIGRASANSSQFLGTLSQTLADQLRARTAAGSGAGTAAPAGTEMPTDATQANYTVNTPPGNYAAGGLRFTKTPPRTDSPRPDAQPGPQPKSGEASSAHTGERAQAAWNTATAGASRAMDALRSPQVAGAVGLAAGALATLAAKRTKGH